MARYYLDIVTGAQSVRDEGTEFDSVDAASAEPVERATGVPRRMGSVAP